jgi:Spy/CpxP family protein refolding chaperone
MARHIPWLLSGVLLLPSWAGAAVACEHIAGTSDAQQQARPADDSSRRGDGRGDSPRRPWWIDEHARAELSITDQQSASIDQVWQKSLPGLREARERLDKLEDVLSQMILDAADETPVVAQNERVESARAEANKTRTLMLYRMNRLLTPDQRVKLKAMHDRMEASRRSPKGPPSR